MALIGSLTLLFLSLMIFLEVWKTSLAIRSHGVNAHNVCLYGGCCALQLDNGDEYTGQCEDKKMHGVGVYKWFDGSTYTGQWKNGKRDGTGVMMWADGRTYAGLWENDVPQDNAILPPPLHF